MLFKQHDKSKPGNSTHCATLHPQNDDRIVATDSVDPVTVTRVINERVVFD